MSCIVQSLHTVDHTKTMVLHHSMKIDTLPYKYKTEVDIKPSCDNNHELFTITVKQTTKLRVQFLALTKLYVLHGVLHLHMNFLLIYQISLLLLQYLLLICVNTPGLSTSLKYSSCPKIQQFKVQFLWSISRQCMEILQSVFYLVSLTCCHTFLISSLFSYFLSFDPIQNFNIVQLK